jgi:hypothetical protein
VTALTRLADAGCTAHEIAAMSGHASLKMVEHYTRAANQAQLARAAVAKENKREHAPVKPMPGFDRSAIKSAKINEAE